MFCGGERANHTYTGKGPDTVRWERGNKGLDDLFDFDIAPDKPLFRENFFQVQCYEQWEAVNLAEKLEAVDNGPHSCCGPWLTMASISASGSGSCGSMTRTILRSPT